MSYDYFIENFKNTLCMDCLLTVSFRYRNSLQQVFEMSSLRAFQKWPVICQVGRWTLLLLSISLSLSFSHIATSNTEDITLRPMHICYVDWEVHCVGSACPPQSSMHMHELQEMWTVYGRVDEKSSQVDVWQSLAMVVLVSAATYQ